MRGKKCGPKMDRGGEYGRTTITVPRHLKKRMKRVGVSVNWSGVACEAFERRLSEIEQVEQVTTIEGAVARMKQLHSQQENSGEFEAGREFGKRWALNNATPQQLADLEAMRFEFDSDEWLEFFSDRRAVRKLTMCLLPEAVRGRRRGRNGPEVRGIRLFWREVFGGRRPESFEVFPGFVDGALEVWGEVKSHLD